MAFRILREMERKICATGQKIFVGGLRALVALLLLSIRAVYLA